MRFVISILLSMALSLFSFSASAAAIKTEYGSGYQFVAGIDWTDTQMYWRTDYINNYPDGSGGSWGSATVVSSFLRGPDELHNSPYYATVWQSSASTKFMMSVSSFATPYLLRSGVEYHLTMEMSTPYMSPSFEVGPTFFFIGKNSEGLYVPIEPTKCEYKTSDFPTIDGLIHNWYSFDWSFALDADTKIYGFGLDGSYYRETMTGNEWSVASPSVSGLTDADKVIGEIGANIDQMTDDLIANQNKNKDEIMNEDFGYEKPDDSETKEGIQAGIAILDDMAAKVDEYIAGIDDGINDLIASVDKIGAFVDNVYSIIPLPVTICFSGLISFLIIRKVVGR